MIFSASSEYVIDRSGNGPLSAAQRRASRVTSSKCSRQRFEVPKPEIGAKSGQMEAQTSPLDHQK